MGKAIWTTIGVSVERPLEAVRHGLPVRNLVEFIEKTQLPREAVLKVVKLSEHDLQTKQQLTPEESERLWRLAAIYESSLRLYEGDSLRAVQWLNTPQREFGGVTPLEHVVTEPGAAQVQELIGRIEYGVLS